LFSSIPAFGELLLTSQNVGVCFIFIR
jgi:hypothetical protein